MSFDPVSHRIMANNISMFLMGVFIHYDSLYSYGYSKIANLNICINDIFPHHCLLMSLHMHGLVVYECLNMTIGHLVCLKHTEAKIHNYASGQEMCSFQGQQFRIGQTKHLKNAAVTTMLWVHMCMSPPMFR